MTDHAPSPNAAEAGFWDAVYHDRAVDQLGWYQADYTHVLAQIAALKLGPDAPILDAGAGRSGLVRGLTLAGYRDVTAIDISAHAMTQSTAACRDLDHPPRFICADLRNWQPPRHYHLWHDRAVFHFLTDPDAQAAYVQMMARAVIPKGHVILSVFHQDGPEQCSGLPVQRYDAATLAARLGSDFTLRAAETATHHTPSGVAQLFLRAHFVRAAGVSGQSPQPAI